MGNVLKAAYLRNRASWYISTFINIPYRWGGDDPMAGFDCSGLIIEVLQAVGILVHNSDYTAHNLFTIFKPNIVDKGYAGCLTFWFKDDRAIHVEMMIDDYHTVGASGGGSKTTTIDEAVKANAFVKMRPLTYRGQNFKIVDPFKGIE